MAITVPIIKSWGALSLPRTAVSQVVITLDNGLNALPDAMTISEALVTWGDSDFWSPWGGSGTNIAAHFNGKRISTMRDLHDLTNAPCSIYEVYDGVTTEAAFNAKLALRAESPMLVFEMEIADNVNGDTHNYYFAERAQDLTGLYQHPVFAGVVEDHETTLNRFDLIITDTQKSEEKQIPEVVVRAVNWPNAGEAEGLPYPVVYGRPGGVIDADKIQDFLGGVPAVPVDPDIKKYVVAGHALTQVGGETDEANTIALFYKVPGYNRGLGYIEGAAFDKSGTDGEGNTIATVTQPEFTELRLYIPTITEGDQFLSTCTDPANATGRDASTEASLAPGEILSLAIGSQLGNIPVPLRVYIKTSKSSSDLDARWVGVSANITGADANGPIIDSFDGWARSGKVEIGGTVYTYSTIQPLVSGVQLLINSYGGPSSGAAYNVGAWQTLDNSIVEITGERSWTGPELALVELVIKNTSGVTTHNIGYLGVLLLFAEGVQRGDTNREFIIDSFKTPTGRYNITTGASIITLTATPPDIGQAIVACHGKSIIFNSTAYGASQNPAVILADVFTSLLGFAESDLGSTFLSAISITSGWKLDFALATVENSRDVINEIMRQSRLFLWRDGSGKTQVGVLRQDASSDITLTRDADIDDPTGDGLVVSRSAEDLVYNRVYLRWEQKGGRGDYASLYYITESDSSPEDLQREGLAATSQSAHRVTRTLEVDAPYIQDADTALRFLQFLFDWHRTRRNKIRLRTPMHTAITPGTVMRVEDTDLGTSENFLVEEVTRSGDRLDVDGIAINLESGLEDQVGYELKCTTALSYGWGAAEFFETWGGSIGTESGVTDGRVVDYGLSLLANRHYEDTTEKITHGAFGSGVAAIEAGQVTLDSQISSRAGLDTDSRSGTEVTIQVSIPSGGTARAIREVGLFTGLTGSNMVARVLFSADVNVAASQALVVYFRITLKRPSIGTSGATDYGLDLLAQRVMNDTAEKPTHMAIGTDTTAEDGGDVALGAQISSRVAIHADYPQLDGMSSDYRGDYDAATYGGNTVAELGIFSGSAGNNAIARNVPPTTIAVGALDDFIQRHKLTAVHYT